MDNCDTILKLMDERFMYEALEEAKKAYEIGEVPIGAVVVCEGRIVGRGSNRMEIDKDATCHAEILAIKDASRNLDRWRLTDCDIYITTDPCPMCSGAINLCRFANVYVGTRDGILEEQCRSIIQDFFKELRKRDKEKKLSEEKQ